ncbi:MAG: bifunctional diaminohydroxyphosphoribosylaminopyrimidine deaminase/5-amino-6-(5-phosphoribosylamino)uracil reductase RibD [candidate division KSB1 bacterium]|nr:bifunctional diaminohydroxyphosphoribosylaminopyrimidine deaminase/5-amino-6-(5-phosphoribosylamino)uracil reductase RibD [candidate division KSB1 bacterium]MDZ7318715.1 bifunctional diaminohydroxyphosphoribosylaminopyrimidine deaminase/5-amino-6-(5-phosphoribosylamino)uracil reductase RibD [candidate division KSB1 bacterium]MDZ7340468.1 bifunctional diaminohydroxyphosphoribosylaminopyrimidine deaminase/5-amino-6-(5-phosphoribosylamino)uracil reductase RibD [candidate division KSB1 bacterium]
MTDQHYMRQALRFARKGLGYVNPNPMVGSVIVKDGVVVGAGYHRRFGQEHAEVMALRAAGEQAQGATLYVNLEPCCHYGKTPPCTNAIIAAGIKRVVVGMVDPNPLVNQKGIDILKAHHIEVISGVEEDACKELNRVFIKYITTGMPYVTLKIAQTLDGRIASRTGHSQWITSYPARVMAHRLRHAHDAVVVGIGTVLADDPQLTVRHVKGRNPWRVVLDTHLQIPLACQLLNDPFVSKTIVATAAEKPEKIAQLQERGVTVWQLPLAEAGHLSLPHLLQQLAAIRVSAVMVEGGGRLYTSFLNSKLVDHIIVAIAPKILGAGIEAIGDLGIRQVDQSLQLDRIRYQKLGPDFLISGDIRFDSTATGE